jgi:hypothetical protein
MTNYENSYININGNNFENEIAKIMLRYKNEGKPDIIIEEQFANDKKQVRFEGENPNILKGGVIGGAEMIKDNRV